MSDFLMEWDVACGLARELGVPVMIQKLTAFEDDKGRIVDPVLIPVGSPIARTMHPSFIATPTPKHDPERDQ